MSVQSRPPQRLTPQAQVIGLVGFLGVCLAAAAIGGMATAPAMDGWYQTLEKPSWQPPAWVFGPVWTVLYLLMAVAAWLVWKPGGFRLAAVPLTAFAGQLILNVAWSWIFFRLQQPGWALLELLVLWLAIALTTWLFFRRSATAAVLMLPYLGWVTFAGVLNFAIWRLNT